MFTVYENQKELFQTKTAGEATKAVKDLCATCDYNTRYEIFNGAMVVSSFDAASVQLRNSYSQ